MSGLGLILGAGLAGGMQGLGEGATKSLQMSQEAQQKEDLVKLQAQLEEQKDERIAALNHDYRTQENAALYAHQDTTQSVQNTYEGGQGDKNRANMLANTGLAGTNALAVAKVEGGYRLDAQTIASNATKYAADLEANKQTIQSDAHGNFVLVNPTSGKTQALLGADGKQMVGMKDLPQSTILIAKSMLDQAHAMLQMDPYNKAALDLADSGRAMLGYAPGGASKTIDPRDLDMMAQGKATPANFDQKYGAGAWEAQQKAQAAQAAVVQVAPQLAGSAAAAPVPLPGQGPAPGGKANPLPVSAPGGGGNPLVDAAAAAPTATAPAAAPAAPAAAAPTTQGTAPTTQGTAPTMQAAPYVQPSPAVTASRQGAQPQPQPGLIASHFVPRGPVVVPPTAGYQPDTENHFVSRVATGAPGTTQGNTY